MKDVSRKIETYSPRLVFLVRLTTTGLLGSPPTGKRKPHQGLEN